MLSGGATTSITALLCPRWNRIVSQFLAWAVVAASIERTNVSMKMVTRLVLMTVNTLSDISNIRDAETIC